MASTVYICSEKLNGRCIVPCMNNLNIKNFITRLTPEKLQWALTAKQVQEIFISLLFLLYCTAQVDATSLLGSKTPTLIFRVLLCSILSDFPTHVHWSCIITRQHWVRKTEKNLLFLFSKPHKLCYLDLRLEFVLILQWWVLMEPDQLKFSGHHWQTCCVNILWSTMALSSK